MTRKRKPDPPPFTRSKEALDLEAAIYDHRSDVSHVIKLVDVKLGDVLDYIDANYARKGEGE